MSGTVEPTSLRNRHKKGRKNEPDEKIKSPAVASATNRSYANILKLLISMKMFAAFCSNISDCDETYNYWEPLHFLFYESGFQTWEYSPEYALRSYMYLMIHVLHAVPVLLVQFVMPVSPVFVFYMIRSMLAAMCAIIEFYFFKAILKEFGSNIAFLSVIFLSFAPGSFIAGTALLPSSWSMMFSTAAFTVWIHRKFELAIFFTAISAIVGWPFSALLGLPLAIDLIVLRRKLRTFLVWSLISAVVILGPAILVDSMFYGQFTFTAWNIVRYNVLSDKGPDLYGTEPLSYYLLNGFLNFNVVWVLSFLAPVLIMALYVLFPKYAFKTKSVRIELLMMPFLLWVLVFFRQPHKEERFLFPIYPLVCLCGAISMDSLQKIYFLLSSRWSRTSRDDYSQHTRGFVYAVLVVFVALGFSRMYAQYEYYRAPADLMQKLRDFKDKHRHEPEVNVCFGKDWYRSPSAFFLPDTNWRLRIVRSDFAGMLPVPFAAQQNATKLVHAYFNDRNVATSAQLYFPLDKCRYLLYFDDGKATVREPRFHLSDTRWHVVDSKRFIDLEKSPRLYRSFAVPLLSDRFNVFGRFYLLKNALFD